MNKRDTMRSILTLTILTFLAGCGSHVEVPPAHVGKILTRNGYAPDIIAPSKFRLPACLAYCDRLVVLEASDVGLVEKLVVFMPEDKLNLAVDIRGTFSVPSTQTVVTSIFDRVVAQEVTGSLSMISAQKVYQTYGQQALRGIVRSEITKYTIADVLSQREAIGQNIHAALIEKLADTNTPLIVSRFELADIQPPSVIIEAQQSAKEREIDIQRAEADAQVKLVEADRDLEVAKRRRLVDREKAEAIAEQNLIAANSVTPELLAYRRLEAAERIYMSLAQSQNVVIVPADAQSFSNLTDDAVLAKLLGRELRQ